MACDWGAKVIASAFGDLGFDLVAGPLFQPRKKQQAWLNLNKAARLLGVAPKTLRLAAEAGEIEGVHPLPDGPWIFSRSTLGEPAAQSIVHRARQNPKYPTRSHPDQQNLFTSTT